MINNKILLAVEAQFLSVIKDSYYFYITKNYTNPNMMGFNEQIAQAKADAEKMVEDVRREEREKFAKQLIRVSQEQQKYLGE